MLLKKSIHNIILFIVCILPFISSPGYFDSYFMIKAAVLLLCTMLILVKWIIYEKNKRHQLEALHPIVRLGMLYWLLVALSMLFSVDKMNSLFGFSNRWDGFIILTCYIVLLFIASLYFEITEGNINLILGSGIVMSFIGYLQFFQIFKIADYNYPLGNAYSVAFGTMGNPNYMGSYLVIILTISTYLYLEKRNLRYFISSAFIYGSLLMTMTRGAWLGALLAILILFRYFILKFKRYKSVTALTATFFIITLILDLILNGRIVLRFFSIFFDFAVMIGPEPDPAAGSFRLMLWLSVISGIPHNILFGVGMSNLVYVIKNYSTSTFLSENAHNEMLHIAATTGVPSMIVYLLMIGYAIYLFYRNLGNKQLNILFLALIIGYFAQSMFAASVVSFSFFLWIILGTGANYNLADEYSQIKMPLSDKRINSLEKTI